MFQSVIGQQELGARRLGTGVGASVTFHAGLLALLLVLSARTPEQPEAPLELTFTPQRPPLPPKGSPAPAPAAAPARPRRNPMRMPDKVVPLPPEPPPPAEPEPAQEPPVEATPSEGVIGGHPDGVVTGGVLGAILPPGFGGGSGGGSEEVLPFGSGMQPPRRLSGEPVEYTREALEARVEGTLIARCVITREGRVESCRVLRGLPHMEQAVVAALESWRYQPVHFQGRPVSVSYVFNLHLKLP